MKQRQQGDVLIYKVKAVPEGAKRMEPIDGKFIIARGEATGHTHCIEAKEGLEVYEKDGILFLKADSLPPPLVHEEHKPHVLETGITAFEIVREKDHLNDLVRKIVD